MNAVAIALHVVAATFWIGGMFFALVVLRPAGAQLEPPQRLQLWASVFKRFFPWVWMAVMVLMITGYWLVLNWFNGFANTPDYVHLMHLIGWIMTLLFTYLYYRPYRA
ncbi:MAG: CopD family protein, partial [Pseudomonadota bacterium]